VAVPDGRRRRRARNRDAVVEALLDLYREGNLTPSADEITGRAGLSPRSLFRYFDDLDDLARTAIERAQHDVAHLLAVDARPDDPLHRRVEALVSQRDELFEAVESVALVTRLRAPFSLVVADNLRRARRTLRNQVAELFAPELAALPDAVAEARLAALDVVTSFEGYRLLRDDQGLTRAAARTTLTDAITRLLTDGGPS
jgi:AcrR family transcriptional regulator